jgi:DHA2 family multidrug resistance protein-like MFS transporter
LDADQAAAASETLGGAVEAARGLPSGAAAELLQSAFDAFDSGVSVTAGIASVLMVSAAVLAYWSLRPGSGVRQPLPRP